ncbi:hypothetical protein AYI68_g1248 [Smittium mucronatum]|uniref:Reverse transcriptase domain-containing protein n=1 Tax=Smittium mucronatum TaxID=133383 RepID=A0A1R0H5Y5_9FUNG|nr:hypothetical protein AYI68_g1248 [Smittium mucronatum]
MYDSGEIPINMDTSIVVPVPKKGDMKDPNNYRGISLIPTLSKLLSKTIATKLSQIDKKYEILVKEQAGFRNFEECAVQATTLTGYDVSKPTEYLCGLRQGCSASPILFDSYINDLFEGIKEDMSLDSSLGYLGCSLPMKLCYWPNQRP